MNEELDRARRGFLDECEAVVRFPYTYFLTGLPYTPGRRVILPVPLYTEIGIKWNAGSQAQLETRFAKKEAHIAFEREFKPSDMEKGDKDIVSEIRGVIGQLIDPDFENFFKIGKTLNSSLHANLGKAKFKVWSLAPRHGLDERVGLHLDRRYFGAGLSVLLFGLGRGISGNDLWQALCRFADIANQPELKEDLLGDSEKKLSPDTVQVIGFFKDLLSFSGLLCADSALCFGSLFGTGFDHITHIMRSRESVAFEVTKRKKDGRLRISLVENPTHDLDLALVCCQGEREEKQPFRQLLKPCAVKAMYDGLYLRLLGQRPNISHALEAIKETGEGWVHYFSATSGWNTEFASFLSPEEYKPRPVSEGFPIEVVESSGSARARVVITESLEAHAQPIPAGTDAVGQPSGAKLLTFFGSRKVSISSGDKQSGGFLSIDGKLIKLSRDQKELCLVMGRQLKSDWDDFVERRETELGWVSFDKFREAVQMWITHKQVKKESIGPDAIIKAMSRLNKKIRKALRFKSKHRDLIENGDGYNKPEHYRLKVYPPNLRLE